MKFFARLVSLALWAVLPAVGAGLDVAEYQAYVDSLLPEVSFGLSVRSVNTGKELANINGNAHRCGAPQALFHYPAR